MIRAYYVVALPLLFGAASLVPARADETSLDRILTFFRENVVDRKMVTTQWEPKQRDPQTGKEFQRTFIRTSWYSNARKTDFRMTVEYKVTIDWKSFLLDEKGGPKGEPFNRTSYDTKIEITLASYPGHERLRGIFRATGGTQDDKPREIGPSDYQRATVYLSNDDAGREILRMDVNGLFPMVSKAAPSGTPRLVDHDFYETLWLEDGRLHRSQLWRDYLVDPHTLQRGRPLTEDKEIYLDSEK